MEWQYTGRSLKGPPGESDLILPIAQQISSPSEGLKLPIVRVDAALRVVRLDALTAGTSPSLVLNLRFGPDFSAAGTELVTGGVTVQSTTTGELVTAFDVDQLAADDWLWLVTTSLSGTVSWLHVGVHLQPAPN